MERSERDDQRDDLEQVAGQEASQSSLDELDPDTSGKTTQPGRGAVSDRASEPSPTGTVGVSDYPVDEGDTASG